MMNQEFVDRHKERVSGMKVMGISVESMSRDELIAVIGMLQANLMACHEMHQRDRNVLLGGAA